MKVWRPTLWLIVILVLGLVVIYLDQTNQLPFAGNTATPQATPGAKDPYSNFK